MTIRELIKKMQSVRADSGKFLDRALLKGGEKIRGNAVLLCPVDTGELRNSIRVQRIAPGVVTVGTNKGYAIFVEYGTGTHYNSPDRRQYCRRFPFYNAENERPRGLPPRRGVFRRAFLLP